MKDLKLDNLTHDLTLSANLDLEFVEDVEAVAQEAGITLRAHQGEWLFNTSFGIPYREVIFSRQFTVEEKAATFKSALIGVAGVNSIQRLELSLDAGLRELSVEAAVDTIYAPITIQV